MSHAADPRPMIRLDWNDEAIVANGDQLILDGFAGLAHQTFQSPGYARTQPGDLVTYTRQLRTGAVIQFACGQDLVRDARAEAAQLDRQTGYKTPKHRRHFTFCQ